MHQIVQIRLPVPLTFDITMAALSPLLHIPADMLVQSYELRSAA
jgi:hypothetical protein